MKAMKEHLVVFDGTSAFVIPSSDFNGEFWAEILYQTNDFEEACEFVDEYNETV